MVMNSDDPLDFESEYSISEPLVSPKKRKKVIGLDDLFNDHKKEQEKFKKRKLKGVKSRKLNASDDDDDDGVDETEHKLTEALRDFQKTITEVDGKEVLVNDLDGEDVSLSWGLQVFGTQRTPSPVIVPDLGSCMLLQNSGIDKISSLLDHGSQLGETFLRGLLVNGWLSKLIMKCGYLEESLAKWTFNLLLYSSDESLMTSACDFWCAILLCKEVDGPVVKIEWLPDFLELKRALESFGFQLHSSINFSSEVESPRGSEHSNPNGSVSKGPPINIRAWIKFVDACSQVRSRYIVLSSVETEELVGTLVCLFLEQQLLGLTLDLRQSLISAINFFEDKEWDGSCERMAKSLVHRVPRDSNCLRVIECISGVDARSKQLRSTVASHFLRSCFNEMTDSKDVLKFLMSLNLKNKSCDLFRVYLYLVLTENWLLFDRNEKPAENELWNSFIWKCSSQISNTDFRPCAQEIRTRAAYLLQSSSNKCELDSSPMELASGK